MYLVKLRRLACSQVDPVIIPITSAALKHCKTCRRFPRPLFTKCCSRLWFSTGSYTPHPGILLKHFVGQSQGAPWNDPSPWLHLLSELHDGILRKVWFQFLALEIHNSFLPLPLQLSLEDLGDFMEKSWKHFVARFFNVEAFGTAVELLHSIRIDIAIADAAQLSQTTNKHSFDLFEFPYSSIDIQILELCALLSQRTFYLSDSILFPPAFFSAFERCLISQ